MGDATKPDPERLDDDNPEPSARELSECSERIRDQREWDALRAYGEAGFRAILQAE